MTERRSGDPLMLLVLLGEAQKLAHEMAAEPPPGKAAAPVPEPEGFAHEMYIHVRGFHHGEFENVNQRLAALEAALEGGNRDKVTDTLVALQGAVGDLLPAWRAALRAVCRVIGPENAYHEDWLEAFGTTCTVHKDWPPTGLP